MTPEELRLRILSWEDPHTDFKRELGRRSELAKDLVCFANSDGGQLIVGVADDRSIVGVGDVDALMIEVDEVAFQMCRPPVTAVPETVVLDDKRVLVINVAKGDQRPYATNDGIYFVRAGSRCRRASQEELLRLFQASRALFYDEQPVRHLGVDALDLDEFTRHVGGLGMAELRIDHDGEEGVYRLLRSWRLLDGDVPTVAGVVLFGRAPQDVLPATGVIVGRVKGTELGGDFIDRKDLRGGLFQLLTAIEEFLSLHLHAAHAISGFEPEKREDIPLTALREAVVNALIHRDYTIPGPLRVFVYDDRVDVMSPGRPPNSVDADAMRAGAHVPRNPYIYARIADAQFATRAGSGIRRIIRVLREAGAGPLEIQVTDAQVTLSLPRRTVAVDGAADPMVGAS